jgi:hypothetical protein
MLHTRHAARAVVQCIAARALDWPSVQVNEYKYEIERLTRELQDVKRRYYEQKRREQLTNAPEQPKGRQSSALCPFARTARGAVCGGGAGRVVTATVRLCARAGRWTVLSRLVFAGYAVQQRANGPRFTGGGFSLGA